MEMQMKKWSRKKKEFLIQHGWEKMHKVARKLKLMDNNTHSTRTSTRISQASLAQYSLSTCSGRTGKGQCDFSQENGE